PCRSFGREPARDGQQHPDPGRPRRADRARGEERDPDRRVRAPGRGDRPAADAGRGGRGARAPEADPDDQLRVHLRRDAAGDRQRARRRDAPVARHRSGVRHVRGDDLRADLHPGVLRRHSLVRPQPALPPPARPAPVAWDCAIRPRRSPRVKRLAAILASSAALSTCTTVGPDYTPVLPDAAAQGSALQAWSDAAFTPETPPGDWWRLYDDARLHAFVGKALEATTDWRRAAANLARARVVLREARTGQLPTPTLSG